MQTYGRLLALALVATFILTTAILAWTLSSRRAFQIDEVEHIHAAYNIRVGSLIYEDFRQSHNPLLYYVLGPTIDPDDPEGSFRRARRLTTLMLTVTVLLIGLCGWRLAGPSGGLLAVGLALAHSTLIERGMEVRTDGPMALCATAALAVELSKLERLRRYGLEALLLSLAFLFTNKAIFVCFGFGCLWLIQAIRRRRWRLIAIPMILWTAPVVLALAIMAAAGNLEDFIAINFGDAFGEVTHTAGHTRGFDPTLAIKFLAMEGGRNLLFCGLAVAGWIAGLMTCRRSGSRLGFPVFLAAVLFASLWINPFPYPYFHVTVLPAFVVLAAATCVRLGERFGWTSGSGASLGLVLALLLGAGAQSVPHLISRVNPDMEHQFEILRELHRVTDSDDAVFDMTGFYFRPDATPYYIMTGNSLARYARNPLYPIPETLRRSQTTAYMFNYRITWLPEAEKTFLDQHFVAYDRNLFLLGSPLAMDPGETVSFEVLKGKTFRYDGEGSILVDGEPFREGFLEQGPHRVTRVERRGADRLIMATPPPTLWPPRPPVQLYDVFQ